MYTSCKKDEKVPCVTKLDFPITFPYSGNETLKFLNRTDTLYYKGGGYSQTYNRVKYYSCYFDLMIRSYLFKEIKNQDSLIIYQSVIGEYTNYNYILFKQTKFITSDTPRNGNFYSNNIYFSNAQIIADQLDSNHVIVDISANTQAGTKGKGILQFKIDTDYYDLIP